MTNPESIFHKSIAGTKEAPTHIQESEQRREYHFRAFVQSHLLNTLQSALGEANFSSEEEDEFLSELSTLNEEERQLALYCSCRNRSGKFAQSRPQESLGACAFTLYR